MNMTNNETPQNAAGDTNAPVREDARRPHKRRGAPRGEGRGPKGPRGKRGERRKRPLAHGDLGLLILSLIEETPRHGYDLIAEISERTKGAYTPSPGVIYPALETLQDLGLATLKTEGGKRVMHLLPAGGAKLTQEKATLEAINERLAALPMQSEERDPTNVRAALHQLRHTAKQKLGRHNEQEPGKNTALEEKRIAAVKIIDEARSLIAAL